MTPKGWGSLKAERNFATNQTMFGILIFPVYYLEDGIGKCICRGFCPFFPSRDISYTYERTEEHVLTI